MQKSIIVFLLVLFTQIHVQAQQPIPTVYGGAGGYVHYGWHVIDASPLNHSLKKYQLPAFNPTSGQMGIGIGGGVFLNRFYMGGQGAIQFGMSASNEQYRTHLMSGYGMIQGGYTLLHTSSVALYPTLGLGGSSMVLEAAPSYAEHPDYLS